MNQADHYFAVIKDEKSSPDEKNRLRDELNQAIRPYSDDPAYSAFLEMQRLAAEAKAKGNGNGSAGAEG